ERKEREHRRRRFVQGLEQRTTESAVVDHWPAQEERMLEVGVDAPQPLRLPEQIEAVGMLEEQQRLRGAVAHLLLDVGLHRVAAEVPDYGGGADADPLPVRLQPPAQSE